MAATSDFIVEPPTSSAAKFASPSDQSPVAQGIRVATESITNGARIATPPTYSDLVRPPPVDNDCAANTPKSFDIPAQSAADVECCTAAMHLAFEAPAISRQPPSASCAMFDASSRSEAADDDSHVPRSASSAMPDLNSASVPKLRARVHQHLSEVDCAQIPLEALHFRPLLQQDLEEMIALHTEWFPVSYDVDFYQKCVRGELFSMVACYCPSYSSSSPACRAADAGDSSNGMGQESLLGIITMSTNCEHHSEDITAVLGQDCSALCGNHSSKHHNIEDDARGESCSGGNAPAKQTGRLAYILTLGVVDGFRRRGLARELLKRLIQEIERSMLHVQALYLHVVTYNGAAIKLYEAMNFHRVTQFTNFYWLHGQHYDSYLYALYLNGGRPWRWRLWTLSEWALRKFGSLLRLALSRRPVHGESTENAQLPR